MMCSGREWSSGPISVFGMGAINVVGVGETGPVRSVAVGPNVEDTFGAGTTVRMDEVTVKMLCAAGRPVGTGCPEAKVVRNVV